MQDLNSIINSIQKTEEEKRLFAKYLRETEYFISSDRRVLENKLFEKSGIAKLNEIIISGVDGGLIKQEMHGIDIILTRAVAALFLFKDGKLSAAKYLPSKIPKPEVTALYSIDRQEFEVSSSLLRIEKELRVAILALDENPHILLMDGSIVPHPMDQPAKDSKFIQYYEEIISLYSQLYKKAIEKKVLLAGIVEDSRSKTFCKILKERVLQNKKFDSILNKCSDTGLLYYLLKQGERSFIFRYAKDPQRNSCVSMFQEKDQIYSFYLRTVKEDNPIRIDFLNIGNPLEIAKKISSIVYPTSTMNRVYGIPPVLIEADQRAKLSPYDIELVKRAIFSKIGPITAIKELRRKRRPF